MANEKIPAVSVIIPMYNAEKYISECLNSLLSQTLKNFEVIVIDDCSTDNSFELAENFISAFESKNQKLLVAKITPNSGCPGIPRNIAMNFAKGKYVYFVDSDDFLDSNVLEDFYNAAEEFNADVVHAENCFKYEEIDGKFVNRIHNLEFPVVTEKPTLETFDILKRMADFVEKKYTTLIWNKFYRREFLLENNITFPQITVAEDFIFSVKCILYAKNYLRVPFVGYHYRKHADSVTSLPGTTEKYSLNLIEGMHSLDSFLKEQNFFIENPNYRYLIINFFNQAFSNLIAKHVFFNMNLDTAEVYDFYRKQIFSVNPQKNIPLTAYFFVSMNIYKILAKQQAEEIERLKTLVKND